MSDSDWVLKIMNRHLATYDYKMDEAFGRVVESYDCACGNWTAGRISIGIGVEDEMHREHVAREITDALEPCSHDQNLAAVSARLDAINQIAKEKCRHGVVFADHCEQCEDS